MYYERRPNASPMAVAGNCVTVAMRGPETAIVATLASPRPLRRVRPERRRDGFRHLLFGLGPLAQDEPADLYALAGVAGRSKYTVLT